MIKILFLSLKIKTYVYKRPLTFQKLTNTTNSKAWNIAGIPLLIQKEMLGLGSSQKSFEKSHFLAPFGGMLPFFVGIIIGIFILYKKNTTNLSLQELSHVVLTDASDSRK